MKTVSREWAERMKKAGWVDSTHFWWIDTELKCVKESTWGYNKFPAPTTDEIAEEVSLEDLVCFYADHEGKNMCGRFYREFSRWLYTTRNDPDRMAEVWCKMKRKEVKE